MTFKYDVAFSFLSADLALAEELADALNPSLTTFVYSRKKEDLLGGDGMDLFARVFKSEARLTVILFRSGWGATPWTAFEQAQIKDRALESRMSSFVVVQLDGSELPVWVPATHLYVSTAIATTSDTLAVIRARARQEGAVIRRATPVEDVLARKREAESQAARREREGSYLAVGQVAEQVQLLIERVKGLVEEITMADPDIAATYGQAGTECAIACSRFSTSIVWLQPVANNLNNARLRINSWNSRIRVPNPPHGRSEGDNWKYAIHFVPRISGEDEWVWREAPELDDFGDHESSAVFIGLREEKEYRTAELADHLVRRHFQTVYGGDT